MLTSVDPSQCTENGVGMYNIPVMMCARLSRLLPSPEALALNKELEFAAIQSVLRHLDDNHDGSVDLQESEEVCLMLCTS